MVFGKGCKLYAAKGTKISSQNYTKKEDQEQSPPPSKPSLNLSTTEVTTANTTAMPSFVQLPLP